MGLKTVTIAALTLGDAGWDGLLAYVDACSWRGARSLVRKMRAGAFSGGWARVFAARVEGELAGFCSLAAEDGLVDDEPGRTPYIGYVYVDERFRGSRLSGRLIDAAAARAAELGYRAVYIRSGEVGLYECFGFTPVGAAHDSHGNLETVFVRAIE